VLCLEKWRSAHREEIGKKKEDLRRRNKNLGGEANWIQLSFLESLEKNCRLKLNSDSTRKDQESDYKFLPAVQFLY